MSRQKKSLFAVNIIGGGAVLASYVWGLLAHPGTADLLWGRLPSFAIPINYVTMVLAAVGYLIFTVHLLFNLDPEKVKISMRSGYSGFNMLYLLILVPSAMWMPLTYAMLDHPGNLIWFAIRIVLMVVGMGGLGMLSALLTIQPRSRPLLIAVIGCIFFCIQTVLLDALIWPSFFVSP